MRLGSVQRAILATARQEGKVLVRDIVDLYGWPDTKRMQDKAKSRARVLQTKGLLELVEKRPYHWRLTKLGREVINRKLGGR